LVSRGTVPKGGKKKGRILPCAWKVLKDGPGEGGEGGGSMPKGGPLEEGRAAHFVVEGRGPRSRFLIKGGFQGPSGEGSHPACAVWGEEKLSLKGKSGFCGSRRLRKF